MVKDPALLPRPVVPVRRGVSIGDGFRFGCGLFLATFVAILVGIMLVVGGLLIAQSMGVLPNLNELGGITTAPFIAYPFLLP